MKRVVRCLIAALALCAFGWEAGGVSVSAQQQSRSAPPPASERRVAVTFDDLPFTQDTGRSSVAVIRAANERLLRSITTHRVPAIGFVNEGKLHQAGELEERTSILRLWVEAGLELGNHTYSHRSLFNRPLAEFQADVIRGEEITRRLLAERRMSLRYFRHPFLNTGPNLEVKRAFERFLAERRYQIAPVTHDNDEWIFAQLYSDALHRGDAAMAQRIADAYVPYMEERFEFYEQFSRALFGREIPQVLLLHANQLNADRFDELARMMERRGYRFISLEEALRDEAYAHADNYTGLVGISWLQRWAITRGGRFRREPPPPLFIRQLYERRPGN